MKHVNELSCTECGEATEWVASGWYRHVDHLVGPCGIRLSDHVQRADGTFTDDEDDDGGWDLLGEEDSQRPEWLPPATPELGSTWFFGDWASDELDGQKDWKPGHLLLVVGYDISCGSDGVIVRNLSLPVDADGLHPSGLVWPEELSLKVFVSPAAVAAATGDRLGALVRGV